MNQKIQFISYGNKKFNNAKARIKNQAIETNWFDSVKVYEPDDLTQEFKKKYKDILEMPRGGGYWIWKLDIIKQELNKINDNDILIYCDAGCVVNKNGETIFRGYIDMLNNNDKSIISFEQNGLEKVWTVKEIFNYFEIDINSNIGKSGQLLGGIILMRKTKHIDNIFDKYKNILEYDRYLFTDKYNNEQQDLTFRENRHDQSIFSIIRKIYGSIIIKDETNKNHKNSAFIPFIAQRQRSN
jgi:hypothetical protein